MLLSQEPIDLNGDPLAGLLGRMLDEPTEYEFHPLAESYPMMIQAELDRLADRMAELGFDANFPIVRFEDQILDGRARYLAALQAQKRAIYVDFTGTELEAKSFIRTANEERRHLAQEWLQKRRAERVQKVAGMRNDGMSQRAIAEVVGVSQKTVSKDLGIATDTGVSVEPMVVIGNDGKRRKGKVKKDTFDDRKIRGAFKNLASLFRDRAAQLEAGASEAFALVSRCMDSLVSAFDAWQAK